MRRGELFRVHKPSATDPKRFRVFVIVSRQLLIDSNFSTVVCAPGYSSYHGLLTQVPVGVEEGLKHESSIHCGELVSVPKSALTNYVGTLSSDKLDMLDEALRNALGIRLDPPPVN